MLGSLGRLADHSRCSKRRRDPAVSRTGRYVQKWLGDERWDIPLEVLSPDCATALTEAATGALQNRRPYRARAHCVRDGIVQTYDVLALPTSSRWGGTLVGVYINERGSATICWTRSSPRPTTASSSLSAIRDPGRRPFDFQIVHSTQRASQLLRRPPDALQWSRLIGRAALLCCPTSLSGLLGLIDPAASVSFDGRQRRPQSQPQRHRVRRRRLADDLRRHLAEEARGVVPPAVRQAIRCRCGCSTRRASNSSASTTPRWRITATSATPSCGCRCARSGRSRNGSRTASRCCEVGDSYQSEGNWRHLKADGTEIEVMTFGRRVVFDGRDGFLVAVVDITERRKAEAEIAHMAHHDGAHRSAEPRAVSGAAADGAGARRAQRRHASRCCASISTSSRTSTTRSAIRSATGCCNASPSGCAPQVARQRSGGAARRRRIRGRARRLTSPIDASDVARAADRRCISAPYDHGRASSW